MVAGEGQGTGAGRIRWHRGEGQDREWACDRRDRFEVTYMEKLVGSYVYGEIGWKLRIWRYWLEVTYMEVSVRSYVYGGIGWKLSIWR